MKMLSVQVDDKFVQLIDEVVKLSGLYSSRSEFLKDALRKNVAQMQEMLESRKAMRESAKRLGEKARATGWNGELPTRKERIKIADEFMKKKGWA